MKSISRRALTLYALILLFLAGCGLLFYNLVTNADVWAMNRANQHLYSNGTLAWWPTKVTVKTYKNVTDIFVTHGHGDHLGSAIEISQKTGAKITAIFELANYCSSKGAQVNGINLGGWINYNWGKVIATPAFHSSSTPDGMYAGCPCGFIFEIGGKALYHAGDTCLNSEMKILGEIYEPDVVMLPIGGCYTMDIEQAVLASEWLQAGYVQ